MLSLRKVTLKDVNTLFIWANDPTVRENSFSGEAIPFDSHAQWLVNKLKNPESMLFIAEKDTSAVGLVRFDRVEGAWVISVTVDNKYRGKGFSKEIVRKGIQEAFRDCNPGEIIAYIKKQNVASMHLFLGLGFVDTTEAFTGNLPSADARRLIYPANRQSISVAPSRLTLGTVQLGIPYGVSNTIGKPTSASSFQILNTAFKSGVRFLDTARSYGDSEAIIGSWLDKSSKSFSIITKIPNIGKGLKPSLAEKFIRTSLEESLINLHCNNLWGLMFHSYTTIREYRSVAVNVFNQLRKEGIVRHIGVSVYSPEEIIESLKFEFDLYQAPINCFDARWSDKHLQEALKQKYLFARSIYLQGLLLLDAKTADRTVPGSGVYIDKLEKIAKSFNLARKATAFSFINSQKQISSLVIGMETVQQVEENAQLSKTGYLNEEQIDKIRKEIGQVPINILNPSLWPKNS